MRTRKKKLADYGITREEETELFRLARLEENKEVLCKAAEVTNSFLAPYLIKSLQDGSGYYRIFGKMGLRPCTGADFYGYKRKTLAVFKILLREQEYRQGTKRRVG